MNEQMKMNSDKTESKWCGRELKYKREPMWVKLDQNGNGDFQRDTVVRSLK